MNHRFDFDALARDVAHGLSRREALGRLGGGLAAALWAAVGMGKAWGDAGSKSACAQFCASLFPKGPLRDACVSDAAHGRGLCYDCGPAQTATDPAQKRVLCVGAGGPVCCQAGQFCQSGACQNPPTGTIRCAGAEADPPFAFVCGFDCCSDTAYNTCCPIPGCVDPGFLPNPCITCANTQTDPVNCGACGNTCHFANAQAACVGGGCVMGDCNSGFFNCDGNAATGCECEGTGCCGASCQVRHFNGAFFYFNCTPQGAYSRDLAFEACQSFFGSGGVCHDEMCGNTPVVCGQGQFPCACWSYSGASMGHWNSFGPGCACPTPNDPAWN